MVREPRASGTQFVSLPMSRTILTLAPGDRTWLPTFLASTLNTEWRRGAGPWSPSFPSRRAGHSLQNSGRTLVKVQSCKQPAQAFRRRFCLKGFHHNELSADGTPFVG